MNKIEEWRARIEQMNVTKYYGVFCGNAPIPFVAFAFKVDAVDFAAKYRGMSLRECYVVDNYHEEPNEPDDRVRCKERVRG